MAKKYSFTPGHSLIEVNWDDFGDVTELFNMVKGRYFFLNKERMTRKEREGSILDSCNNIYNTDILDLYDNLNLSTEKKYYVYFHCNPFKELKPTTGRGAFSASIGLKYKPFYVGKGCGQRAFNINRSETHRKIKQKLFKENKEPIVEIVKDNLSEAEALSYESKFIDIFGLIPLGGSLTNLDEGHLVEERRSRYLNDYNLLCSGAALFN